MLVSYLPMQTVERHKGLVANLRRPRAEIRDVQLKQELRSAVKTSLYRITGAFGEHISAVQMAPELKRKVENYKNYLEA